MASIVYEIKECLELINHIGDSKRDFKANNKSEIDSLVSGDTPIFSIKYFKDILDSSIKFSQYIKKEFDIKSIFEIKSEHYVSYFNYLDQKGLTKGHLINLESHLMKFQSAILILSERKGKDFTSFATKRIYSSSEREAPKDRSYTQEEFDLIKASFSPKVRQAVQFTLALGVRIKETCNIQVKHFVESTNGLKLFIPQKNKKIGEKGGTGITKGGRFRETPVPKKYEIELRNLLQGKDSNEKVFGMKPSTLRGALSRACKKNKLETRGWHGFRHTYTRRRLEELLGSKKEEGILIVRKMLDNRKKHVHSEKGILDKNLLEFVKEKINQVHSEIGHGQNRWALLEVYMSF